MPVDWCRVYCAKGAVGLQPLLKRLYEPAWLVGSENTASAVPSSLMATSGPPELTASGALSTTAGANHPLAGTYRAANTLVRMGPVVCVHTAMASPLPLMARTGVWEFCPIALMACEAPKTPSRTVKAQL